MLGGISEIHRRQHVVPRGTLSGFCPRADSQSCSRLRDAHHIPADLDFAPPSGGNRWEVNEPWVYWASCTHSYGIREEELSDIICSL
jgi:hypothetical protein